ncbi:MAG: hypothetical protein KDI69_03835, partial [Xanthomonadales bacterium]|nr:hypothetical protein [Xanthomonadales bacterium]
MNNCFFRHGRANSLALAMALAISGSAHSIGAAAADEVSLSGARMQTSALEAKGQYDRFIIKFKAGNQLGLSASSRNQALSLAFSRVGTRLKATRELAVGGQVVELARKLTASEAYDFMSALADQNNVEYVEVDRLNQIKSVPNDTRYGEQWHYFESVGGLNLPSAWDLSTGSGVVVAVLDTGITNHSDLNGNVIAGYDFISTASVAADGNGR